MPFHSYLQQHLIVEWRDKYIQYHILARLLQALLPTTDSIQTKLIAKRAFALLSLTYPVKMSRYDSHKGVCIEISANFTNDFVTNQLLSGPTSTNLTNLTISTHNPSPVSESEHIISTQDKDPTSPPTIFTYPTNHQPATEADSPHSPEYADTCLNTDLYPSTNPFDNDDIIIPPDGHSDDDDYEENLMQPGFLISPSLSHVNSPDKLHRQPQGRVSIVNPNSNSNSNNTCTRPTSAAPSFLIPPVLSPAHSILPQAPLFLQPTTLETIDEHNEFELEKEQREHLESLGPGMQQIQKQQNALLGIAGLNSISQISTFSRQLRQQRQIQLLKQQDLEFPTTQHQLISNKNDARNELRRPSIISHRSLVKYPSKNSDGSENNPINQTNPNNNTNLPNLPLDFIIDSTQHNNAPNSTQFQQNSPRPQSAHRTEMMHLIEVNATNASIPTSNLQQSTASASATQNEEQPQQLTHYRRRPSQHSQISHHSNNSHQSQSQAQTQMLSIATIASKRKRLSSAEYRARQQKKLDRLEKRTSMAKELREALIGPYKSLDIDYLYKTNGNYGSSMNKSLNLNLTTTASQVMQLSTKLRQSLNEVKKNNDDQYEVTEKMYQEFKRRYEREKMQHLHQSLTLSGPQKVKKGKKSNEIGEYDGQFNTLDKGFGQGGNYDNIANIVHTGGDSDDNDDDDGDEYDDDYYRQHDLFSMLSSHHEPDETIAKDKKDKYFTPGYSSHRIAHVDLPHISRESKKKKGWLDYVGLSYFTSKKNVQYDEHGHITDQSDNKSLVHRGTIDHLLQSGHAKFHHQTHSFNQVLYNKLLSSLEKYGDVPPLCRKRRYYETFRELTAYLRKINRTDLLPNLPQVKSPIELLTEYYPIQLRNRQDIDDELANMPIFHTFLPKNCIKYEVELLFCNAVQSQVEKFNEFTLLLEEYYDAHVFNIASILAQLRYSELLLQVCLMDPYGTSINIQSFIAMRDKQLETIRKTINEVYRGIIYLEQYQSLNLLGFAKILKKHDKLSVSFPFSRECLLPVIFSTHAAQTTTGIHIKHYLETFFMQVYADSKAEFAILYQSLISINTSSTSGSSNMLLTDQSQSNMAGIKADQLTPTISIATWVHLGSHAGAIVLLLAANILLYIFYPHVAFESAKFDVGFPIFRILGTLVITSWVWALVTYFCERARINYQLILQLNPRTYLRPPQLFVMASLLTVILLLCFTLFVFTLAIDPEDVYHHYILYGTFLLYIAFLFNPLNMMHRPTRWYMLKNSVFFFLSPFTPATIQTSIIGNYWTSALNRMLYDIGYVTCYYSKYPITQAPPPADAIKVCSTIMKTDFWFIPTIPSFFRGMQGVRSAYYTNEWYPYIASALKYFIAIPDAIASWYMKQQKYILYSVVIYCIFAGIRGLWSTIWDITMDFRICARLQAVSDKYEKLVTHLHETDGELVWNHIDTSSIEHKIHHYGRQSNEKAVDMYYQLNESNIIAPPETSSDMSSLDALKSNAYFNQSSHFSTNLDTNSISINSSINEPERDTNAYISLDSNIQTVGNRSKRVNCYSRFKFFMKYHNNIVHFTPRKLSQKYICCGAYNYSEVPRDIPTHLNQRYSWYGLATWYIFYKFILIPCKFFLSILYVPIFYTFLIAGFLLTCMPCRSTFRHSRFWCKTHHPSLCCGRPKKRMVQSITRQYFSTHKLTKYTFQHEPNFPAWYLSKEIRSLYFNHSLYFYFICIVIDFICRNTFVWQTSPLILTTLGISSEWLSFILALVSLLRRGLWTYLRFENEALKLTNKLQAVNLEGELVGQEHGRWQRKQIEDDSQILGDTNSANPTTGTGAGSLLLGALQSTPSVSPHQQQRQNGAQATSSQTPSKNTNTDVSKQNLNLELTPIGPQNDYTNSHHNIDIQGPFSDDDFHFVDYNDTLPMNQQEPIGTKSLFPSLDAAMEITKMLIPPNDTVINPFSTSSAFDESGDSDDDRNDNDNSFVNISEPTNLRSAFLPTPAQFTNANGTSNDTMTSREVFVNFTNQQHRNSLIGRHSITQPSPQHQHQATITSTSYQPMEYETVADGVGFDMDINHRANTRHRRSTINNNGNSTSNHNSSTSQQLQQLQQVKKTTKNQPKYTENDALDFEHSDVNHFESGGYQRLQ